ncbi:hypothetical protein Dimus_026802 [Dionaea muscipula]
MDWDLEVVLEDELSPIAEVVEVIEELRPPVAALDGGQVGQSGVVVDGLSGVADGPIHGECGVHCSVADEVLMPASFGGSVAAGCVEGEDAMDGELLQAQLPGEFTFGLPPSSSSRLHLGSPSLTAADDFEMGDDLVAVGGRVVGGVAAASCNVGPGIGVNCMDDGCLEVEEDMVGDLEVADAVAECATRPTFGPVMCPSLLSLTAMVCPSFLSNVDLASRGGEGGLVREEGRDPQVAKEALRPQPADGLQQLPRSSEESCQ